MEFRCSNDRCVSTDAICDGDNDCGDASDERGCSTTPSCAGNEFTCANDRCVSSASRCDGDNDCGDGSDEAGCAPMCQDTSERKCSAGNVHAVDTCGGTGSRAQTCGNANGDCLEDRSNHRATCVDVEYRCFIVEFSGCRNSRGTQRVDFRFNCAVRNTGEDLVHLGAIRFNATEFSDRQRIQDWFQQDRTLMRGAVPLSPGQWQDLGGGMRIQLDGRLSDQVLEVNADLRVDLGDASTNITALLPVQTRLAVPNHWFSCFDN